MRSHQFIKTWLVTLTSGALAVALTLGGAPAAWADAPPLAQAEAGIASIGRAGGVVQPNPDEQTIVRLVNRDGGFDWGDAAIGAAIGLAISLLGVGSVRAVSHRRAAPGETALTS